MAFLNFLITTTGAAGNVSVPDLGNRTFPNTLTNYPLGEEFQVDEIRYSPGLALAIFSNGWTATDSLGQVITAQASLALTELLLNKAGHPQNTDALPVGTTNKYFTNTLARQALSINPGSTQYLDYNNLTGEFSISALAVTEVTVDSIYTSLAAWVTAVYSISSPLDLQEGDVIILTAATGGTKTYINNGGVTGTVGDFNLIEAPDLTSSYILGLFSGGDGIAYDNLTGDFDVDLTTTSGLGFSGGQLRIVGDTTTADTIAITSTVNGAGIKYSAAKGLGETSDILEVTLSSTGGLEFVAGPGGGQIKIKVDVTTGVTVAPLTIGVNGAGVTVDNATIGHTAGSLHVNTDGINTLHIDWGTGTNQVSASDVPLDTHTWVNITTPTDVQDALELLDAGLSGAGKKSWSWGASSSAGSNSNRYLDKFDGVSTNQSPYVAWFASKLRAISLSSNVAGTWTAEVHVNGVSVSTLASGGNQYQNNSGLNVSIASGDRVSFYLSGTGINRPSIDALFEEA